MESHDSYPVFHTRLTRTLRRRLTRPDGTSLGWLILTAADPLAELTAEAADLDARDGRDDPPHLAIPRPR